MELLQTEDDIGQNARVVEDDEHPLGVMQNIDHLNDDILGLVFQDSLSGQVSFFHFTDNVWIRYDPEKAYVNAYLPENFAKYIDLHEGSNFGVIPVDVMPFWGDGSFDAEEFFNEDS